MKRLFTGTGVALVTPFFEDGTIDFEAIDKLVDHVIEGGVDFLVPLGSTGETATLNEAEARQVLDRVLIRNNGRKPVLPGNFGGNNTRELLTKIKGYNFEGIDGILSSSPAYVKPTQEGIYRHYMAMAEVCPVPIMLYNVPGRTKSNMEWKTTIRLAKASDKFVGIKEATGDLIQTTRILKNRPEHFIVVSGDDEVALPMTALGGDGVISVIANALPQEFSNMIKFALNGDLAKANQINFDTYDLHHWLYVEGNPVGIKTAVEALGICTNQVRLPLHKISEESKNGLIFALRKILI